VTSFQSKFAGHRSKLEKLKAKSQQLRAEQLPAENDTLNMIYEPAGPI